MRRTGPKAAISIIAALTVVACGDKPATTGRRGVPGANKPEAHNDTETNQAPVGKKKTAKRHKRTAGETVPQFSEQDFIENTEANRDPFRNFLTPVPVEASEENFEDTREILLSRFELTELTLTGIAGRRPRYAMIRSPGGRTTNLVKGVRFSKAKALIVDIADDHIILQIPQLGSQQRPSFVERILWVDPNRKAIDITAQPLKPDEEGLRYAGWRRWRYLRRHRHKGAAP